VRGREGGAGTTPFGKTVTPGSATRYDRMEAEGAFRPTPTTRSVPRKT
jgi:hypothetical protein